MFRDRFRDILKMLISVNNHPSTSLIGGFQSRKSAQPMRGAYLMKQEPVLTIQVSSGGLESTGALKEIKSIVAPAGD